MDYNFTVIRTAINKTFEVRKILEDEDEDGDDEDVEKKISGLSIEGGRPSLIKQQQ